MAERRQAHRREPIEIEVRDRVLEAHPLPWLQRNDLGNELISQYTEMFNSALRSYVDPDTSAPQIENALHDKLTDPITIIKAGLTVYPDEDGKEPYCTVEDEFLQKLEWSELREIIYTILDVNELELKPLVDPNSLTPTGSGGTTGSGSLERVEGILKNRFSPNSELTDSPDEKSSTSPTENSEASSESEAERSTTSDGGSTV